VLFHVLALAPHPVLGYVSAQVCIWRHVGWAWVSGFRDGEEWASPWVPQGELEEIFGLRAGKRYKVCLDEARSVAWCGSRVLAVPYSLPKGTGC